MIETIVLVLGGIQVLKFILGFLWELIKEMIPLGASLDGYGKNTGRWAVVTGGTDGIGLGFCEVLCELGWNLCIISRNEKKIKQRIGQLKEKNQRKGLKIPHFKYIVADFKQADNSVFFQQIKKQLYQLDVGILVNNVGTGDTKQFQKFSLNQIIETININCTSMAGITSILLPSMMKKKSAIINLSSFLGQTTAPYSTLYSATKAFNTFFSQSLSMQENLTSIDILSVRPMFVQSPLSKMKQGFNIPNRYNCAKACLKELRWQYETNGYITHRLLAKAAKLVPKFIVRLISKKQSDHHRRTYHNKGI